MSKQINVSLDIETFDKLSNEAHKTGSSLSSILRKIILEKYPKAELPKPSNPDNICLSQPNID